MMSRKNEETLNSDERIKEQQNERIRGAKQRLNMTENTLRRLELELRAAYESYIRNIVDFKEQSGNNF